MKVLFSWGPIQVVWKPLCLTLLATSRINEAVTVTSVTLSCRSPGLKIKLSTVVHLSFFSTIHLPTLPILFFKSYHRQENYVHCLCFILGCWCSLFIVWVNQKVGLSRKTNSDFYKIVTKSSWNCFELYI